MYVLKQFPVWNSEVSRKTIGINLSFTIPATKEPTELNLSAILFIPATADPSIDLNQIQRAIFDGPGCHVTPPIAGRHHIWLDPKQGPVLLLLIKLF